MKKLLLSAAALVAVLSAPVAYADDQNGNDNKTKQERANHPDRAGQGDKMNGPNSMTGPDARGPGMSGNGPGGDNAKDRDNGNDRDTRNDRNNRDNANGRDNDKRVVVHKTVNRSVVLKVRANITAPRRFHAARIYVRPPGWYPHRWTYGERLPRIFFASDYFILDFAAYGLLSPWDGYEWVRYGDDALLIDVETGEVIRVEYDVFY